MNESHKDENLLSDVKKVLKAKSVSVLFQPIVDVSSVGVIGFEAFARGINKDGKTIADASYLFSDELDLNTRLKVELLCFRNSLESFQAINKKYDGMVLFLNMNPFIFRKKGISLESLHQKVIEFGFEPSSIALEFECGRLEDPGALEDITYCKKQNYLISFDNIGSGPGDFEKMLKYGPHFIKVNRDLYQSLEKKGYKLDFLKTLVDIAKAHSVSVIGKGVESRNDAISLMQMQICAQQGFYYTHEKGMKDKDTAMGFSKRIRDVYNSYRENLYTSVTKKRDTFREFHRTVQRGVRKLESQGAATYNESLSKYVGDNSEVVSAFILDEKGRQVSSRVHRKEDGSISRLSVSQNGADHSLQDYYVYLESGFEKFVTKPAPSRFIEDKTCLISNSFFTLEGKRMVLVAEFVYPDS